MNLKMKNNELVKFSVDLSIMIVGYYKWLNDEIKENCRSIKRMLIATLNTSRKNI